MRIISNTAALLTCAVLAVPAVTAGPASAQTPARSITVTGEAQVMGVPDMATISVGVTTQEKTAKAALDANSTALQSVLAKLKSDGIDPQDIQTTGLSVNPQFDYQTSSGGTQQITGYVASNMVVVSVRKLDMLGGTLDAIVSEGANTLNGINFGLQDPGPKQDEARKAAVTEAARRAQLYADAAGVTLGPVQTITEQGIGMPPVMMAAAAPRDKMEVPVEGGQVTVSAAVSVTWAIAD